MIIASHEELKELKEISDNVKKNARYIRSLFPGTHAGFAQHLGKFICKGIYEQNLREVLKYEGTEWRKPIWVALCRYAGISMQELMFGDVRSNDIMLQRRDPNYIANLKEVEV